jgi:phage nucleotide-binding protein
MNPKTLEALEAAIIDPANEPAWKRILIYADFGLGKTTWATRSNYKTLVIDASEGWVAAKDKPNVTFIRYQGLSMLEAIASAISSNQPGWEYEVVVLDEVSTMYMIDLELVTEASDHGGKIAERDTYIPEQRDYMASQNRLMKAMRPLLKAPCHTVLLAHERRTKDDNTGMVLVESDFAPRLSKEINRDLHVLGRLAVDKQGNRSLTINPERGVQAKNRLGLSNNPTLEDILGA